MAISMQLTAARKIAEGLIEAFEDACERIEIAGSIRREVPWVGDIELVAIPRTRPEGQAGLFGNEARAVRNLLHGRITEASEGLTRIRPIKCGTPVPDDGYSWVWEEPERWQEKATNESKYFRLWIPLHSVRVDLFMATPETWGSVFAIRTGCAEFSHALVRQWTRVSRGGHFHQGRIHPPAPIHQAVAWKSGAPLGRPLSTPEERDVFEALGVMWVPPRERLGGRLQQISARAAS